jgi:hypothetical protein
MRIQHPRFQPGRVTDLGIEFVDGFAEVEELHPERRQALLQHGFTIDETADLEEQTVEQLRTELKGYGYEVKKSWRKPELIERIAQHLELNAVTDAQAAEGGEPFATVELADGTVVDDGASLVTLHTDGSATTESDTEEV